MDLGRYEVGFFEVKQVPCVGHLAVACERQCVGAEPGSAMAASSRVVPESA